MPAAPSGDWKTPVRPDVHACRIPRFTWQDAGREWQCECGAVWTLIRQAAVPPMPLPAAPVLEVTSTPEPIRGRMPDFGEVMQGKPDGDEPAPQHSPTCAHTLGTGMCTCDVRKTY